MRRESRSPRLRGQELQCEVIIIDMSIVTQRKGYYNPIMRYKLPDPLQTDRQFEKFNGNDIDGMTELEAWKEARQLETLLTWSNDRDILFTDLSSSSGETITLEYWLLERIANIRRKHNL